MIKRLERFLEGIVFGSRWIQVPMYLGLIFASALYSARFLEEAWNIFREFNKAEESELMLAVLSLVDATMVLNLVYMVVVGGYSIFVSRMNIDEHSDRPEWLDKTNAATLKIKLASSLVGVSGIHLLKTFIDLGETTDLERMKPEELAHDLETVKWRISIHVVFLLSSLILAVSERVLYGKTDH